MNGPESDTPTLTLTPQGVAGPESIRLAPVSTSDLQIFDRALGQYSGSKNTLFKASAPLLAVCGTLSRLNPGDEMNSTRMDLSRAIIDLKYKIVRLDYPPSVAENLCLLFAIVLDEFILVSPWGAESGWENRTLVADLFGFRDGGDRFYNVADRALMQPRALREFIEIIYIFLKLGYRGKYNRGSEHDRDRLIDRLEAALNLMPQAQKRKAAGRAVKDTRPAERYMPLRRKLALAGGAMGVIILGTWGLKMQAERTLYRDFQAQRLVAESESSVDFIFSSTERTLTAVPRE
ncbi:MAG: type IVB secretion system protein IcmH/DotU [Cypionkella sp.]